MKTDGTPMQRIKAIGGRTRRMEFRYRNHIRAGARLINSIKREREIAGAHPLPIESRFERWDLARLGRECCEAYDAAMPAVVSIDDAFADMLAYASTL